MNIITTDEIDFIKTYSRYLMPDDIHFIEHSTAQSTTTTTLAKSRGGSLQSFYIPSYENY